MHRTRFEAIITAKSKIKNNKENHCSIESKPENNQVQIIQAFERLGTLPPDFREVRSLPKRNFFLSHKTQHNFHTLTFNITLIFIEF